MMPRRAYDVSHLPVYSISSHAPLWWGQVLMAAIEASMFFILIAMYFYVRLSVDVWPPPGIQAPDLPMPTLALIPLIASALGSYIASEGAKQDNRRKMLAGMALNLVLAILFLLLRFVEWRSFNFTWASDIHGTMVWAILFLHTLDAIGDFLFTVVLFVIVAAGRYGPRQRLGVHVDSVVWYFIVLIWIPLYVVIYWGPRIMAGGR